MEAGRAAYRRRRYAAVSAGRLAAPLAVTLLGLGICGGGLRAQTVGDAPPTADYSATELYNAANAYARSGKTALAVLAYERARVFAPRDPDLRSNLRRVRESAGLSVGTGSWFHEYGRFANPNTLYWVGMAGLALGGACLLVLRRYARFRGALLAGAVLGLVAVCASSFNAAATFALLSESVALRQAPASVSPIAGADPLFSIPAAASVQVLDRHGGFELIRDAQGREGWVAASDLAAVIPGSDH
jgi:hypothetical protein